MDTFSSPAERGAKAKRRAEQLQQRRNELATGRATSGESVEQARQHADESMQRARDAHQAAADRHDEAARVHERTANMLQRAAMQPGSGSRELQDRADAHRQAANDSYLDGAEDKAQAADPDKSASQ